jgi:ATP-dependent protease ClpP protease subunit
MSNNMNDKKDWEPHINVIGNDIWYTGDLTLVSINNLIKDIQTCLNSKHVNSKVNLYIGSSGGVVTPTLMLYNYLNLNYKDINVIATSGVCSSATYLLFTNCFTFVYPNTYALFHPMNFEFNDNQQAVKARDKFYKHLVKCVNNVYLNKEFKCNWAKEDIYLFSEDLIKRKIVDGIWKNV